MCLREVENLLRTISWIRFALQMHFFLTTNTRLSRCEFLNSYHTDDDFDQSIQSVHFMVAEKKKEEQS